LRGFFAIFSTNAKDLTAASGLAWA
jgi:hypothetical protein